jgi:hypothetical protein
MSSININKQYKKLYAFGCSITTGHHLGMEGSWSYHLARKLNTECEIVARVGVSNYCLMLDIINLCESTDMSDSCIGIQLTERCRREIWLYQKKKYYTFNLMTLGANTEEYFVDSELKFMRNNINEISPIYFDDYENYIRNLMTILMVKNYLENNNIDYIMFEGISSINEYNEFKNDNINYNSFFNKNLIDSILNNKSFFNKYGPIQPFDFTHPLFDPKENDLHPSMEFIKWWAQEMYEHIKINSK